MSRDERILIVDDEESIRTYLKRVVEAEGYACTMAENGYDALKQLEGNGFQLVLVDIKMPVMDGMELLKFIATMEKELAVIMVTSLVDVNTAVEAMRLGVYDYVVKPFNVAALKISIQRALERRRLILENREYQFHLEQKVQAQTGEIRKTLHDLDEAYDATLAALVNALDAREHETQNHSQRVQAYTLHLARRMGVPGSGLEDLGRGALLHDIGKIGVSDMILLKPAKLTPEEWVEMKKHPQIGYDILKDIPFLKGAGEMVLSHQERYDGTGYPRGLRGEEILLGARIFGAVDCLDAMTSDRPYRKELSFQRVREELARFSGSQFDPQVVEEFLAVSEDTWRAIQREVAERIIGVDWVETG